MRLEHARGYVPGGNARIFTEQAHYAAEFSLKAVIVSRGGTFAFIHNIQELLDTTRRLGETIPAALVPAKELSVYAGTGRYEFDRQHALVPVSADEHRRALRTATATYQVQRVEVLVDVVDEHQQRLFEQRVGLGVCPHQGLGPGCEESDHRVLGLRPALGRSGDRPASGLVEHPSRVIVGLPPRVAAAAGRVGLFPAIDGGAHDGRGARVGLPDDVDARLGPPVRHCVAAPGRTGARPDQHRGLRALVRPVAVGELSPCSVAVYRDRECVDDGALARGSGSLDDRPLRVRMEY